MIQGGGFYFYSHSYTVAGKENRMENTEAILYCHSRRWRSF
ncbi:hypothetical protein QSI_3116 [Clostridioides difficile P28]|nr:hypothetical protein QSI_3116 [Clostridioides difficile P28]